jgi:two-component system sensor histidine kinase CpxA
MKARVSISVKILLLAFLNVLLLGLVFAVFVRVQYRFDLSSLLLSPGRDRILALSRLIALQLPETDRAEWTPLLAQYTSTTHATAYLFSNQGTQLAGPPITLPGSVLETIRRDQGPPLEPEDARRLPPGHRGRPYRDQGPPFEPEGAQSLGPEKLETPPPPPVFLINAGVPSRYWVGVGVPIRDESVGRPVHGTLLWTFSSLWTNSFFFDYKPWLAVACAVILVSVICWVPLIRGLTRSISQLTGATGAIAEGRLETRLSLHRQDELGQLSEAINRMAERLSGLVSGQRRFLGDVAHELCSPLARIEVSLGILDQRAQDNQKEYVQGVQEEVEHMSGLINELLLFTRAQLNVAAIPLTRVNVAEAVRRVVAREAREKALIETDIEARTEVMARPEYLSRSLANVVRNAVRYAGEFGPIRISAREKEGMVSITVADHGPGIPEAELEAVFKPFYRPEPARQRETGGVGLGLAIVRTCIEACGGKVECRNRSPKGLEVELQLLAPKP